MKTSIVPLSPSWANTGVKHRGNAALSIATTISLGAQKSDRAFEEFFFSHGYRKIFLAKINKEGYKDIVAFFNKATEEEGVDMNSNSDSDIGYSSNSDLEYYSCEE